MPCPPLSAVLPRACRAADSGQLQRRQAAIWIPSLAVPVAAWSPDPAVAESSIDQIVAESRRKAKEDAKKPNIWNWNSYKVPTQNYNATDLQSYLPTVFLAKRALEGIREELESPRVNASDPQTYEYLREQNRAEPIKLLRKESFRTKLWLREQSGKISTAETEHNRIKRALDEEDSQCLLLARTDGLVDKAAFRVTKRNVEALVDAIDGLLEMVPAEEREIAKVVSDTKTIPALKFPSGSTRRKKTTAKTTAAAAPAAGQ